MAINKKFLTFMAKHRTKISRPIALFLIFLLLFSESLSTKSGIIRDIFEYTGFILVIICTIGRIWASIYIAGYKEEKVISCGPYSMVRHPLYFFSLLGAAGLGFASTNILVLSIILLLFIIYYPFVLLAEEDVLIKLHGQKYISYMEKTPRFIPKPSLFYEPESYEIKPSIIRKSLYDVIWFPLGFLIIHIISQLHANEILPVML